MLLGSTMYQLLPRLLCKHVPTYSSQQHGKLDTMPIFKIREFRP